MSDFFSSLSSKKDKEKNTSADNVNNKDYVSPAVENATRKALEADTKYVNAIKNMRAYRFEFDVSLRALLSSFESIHITFLRNSSELFNSFLKLHTQLFTTNARGVEKIYDEVRNTTDVIKDIQNFVRVHKNASSVPPLPTYELFEGHPRFLELSKVERSTSVLTSTSSSSSSGSASSPFSSPSLATKASALIRRASDVIAAPFAPIEDDVQRGSHKKHHQKKHHHQKQSADGKEDASDGSEEEEEGDETDSEVDSEEEEEALELGEELEKTVHNTAEFYDKEQQISKVLGLILFPQKGKPDDDESDDDESEEETNKESATGADHPLNEADVTQLTESCQQLALSQFPHKTSRTLFGQVLTRFVSPYFNQPDAESQPHRLLLNKDRVHILAALVLQCLEQCEKFMHVEPVEAITKCSHYIVEEGTTPTVTLFERIKLASIYQQPRYWEASFVLTLKARVSKFAPMRHWLSDPEQESIIIQQRLLCFNLLQQFHTRMMNIPLPPLNVANFLEKHAQAHSLDTHLMQRLHSLDCFQQVAQFNKQLSNTQLATPQPATNQTPDELNNSELDISLAEQEDMP